VNRTINIPFRSHDDSLVAVAGMAGRALSGDDSAIAREVALHARINMIMRTAGELVDAVARMSGPERRELLDQARSAAGLPTTGEADFAADFQALQASIPPARLDAEPPRLGYNAAGLVVDLDEQAAEAAKEEQRQRSRQAELEARRAERQAQAEEFRQHEEAMAQAFKPANLRAP
jgi:hypothetical protein